MKKVAVILTLLCVTSMLNAKPVYIQSNKAALYEQPSFVSASTKTLPRGAKVNVIETSKRWIKIQSETNSGWMLKFLVSDHPPLNHVGKVISDDQQINNPRRRASAVSTAASARGLSADQRQRVGDNSANYFALETIEAMNVRELDIILFLNTGPQQR